MLIIKGFRSSLGKRKVKCCVCGHVVPEKYIVRPKGAKGVHICTRCARSCWEYSHANEKYRGAATHQPPFSFEFETCEQHEDLLVLYKYGFIPCRDGSIEGREWKSPIYRSLRPLKPILPTLERLADLYVDDSCGTHIHVECLNKNYITPHAWTVIWEPLVYYLRYNHDSTVRFWGRFFNDYASRYVEGQSRYEAFNRRTHYNTIEFRLAVFKTAKQFEAVIRFARIATRMIDTFFDEHEPDDNSALVKLGENIRNKYKSFVE